jgi:C-terminal processing protease CtpA/Prc
VAADGYIETYANKMIGEHFSELYYLNYGSQDVFTVRTANSSNQISEKHLSAISLSEWEGGYDNDKHENEYRTLKSGVGLLKVGSFVDTPDRQFKDWISKSFNDISQSKIDHLIIDLRGNSGGRDDYAMYLYSFLSKRPFMYQRSLQASTDNYSFLKYTSQDSSLNEIMRRITSADSTGRFFLRDSHPTLGIHPLKVPTFQGEVYILINGATFSAAADFAAICRQNQIGIFIGEETGGAAIGNTSNGEIILTLPNTKIRVSVPLFMITNAVKDTASGRGVRPDYPVKYLTKDIQTGVDRELTLAIELAEKR